MPASQSINPANLEYVVDIHPSFGATLAGLAIVVTHSLERAEIALYTQSRILIFNTAQLQAKTTRATQGVAVMTLKKNQQIISAISDFDSNSESTKGLRKLKIPATGVNIADKDSKNQQMSFDDIDE